MDNLNYQTETHQTEIYQIRKHKTSTIGKVHILEQPASTVAAVKPLHITKYRGSFSYRVSHNAVLLQSHAHDVCIRYSTKIDFLTHV